jgi:hypothetical protein
MATFLGIEMTLSGSMMAKFGLMHRSRMPALHCFSGMSIIDTPVVSLPVPAVVGTAINGSMGFSGINALPNGFCT